MPFTLACTSARLLLIAGMTLVAISSRSASASAGVSAGTGTAVMVRWRRRPCRPVRSQPAQADQHVNHGGRYLDRIDRNARPLPPTIAPDALAP